MKRARALNSLCPRVLNQRPWGTTSVCAGGKPFGQWGWGRRKRARGAGRMRGEEEEETEPLPSGTEPATAGHNFPLRGRQTVRPVVPVHITGRDYRGSHQANSCRHPFSSGS